MKVFANSLGCQWTNSNKDYFKGYIIYDDVIYTGNAAIDLMKKILTTNNCSQVSNFNGNFCFIFEYESKIVFGVDRIRSMPLFYAVFDGELYVGSDPNLIMKDKKLAINQEGFYEYKSTKIFVSGNRTLIDGLYQVQAGEVCTFDKNKRVISHNCYFRVSHCNFYDCSDKGLVKQHFWNAYYSAAYNLAIALGSRTAVVPLSGGADSRMILVMLHNQGIKNVICYSYGKVGNKESLISKEVAESFGYKWIFVPYTKKMWRKLRNDETVKKYEKYSFCFTSTPHMQDYPAVLYLKINSLIPEDSVFIPGHSGDLLAGSHISPEFLEKDMSKEIFIQSLEKKFYFDKKADDNYHKIINSSMGNREYCSNEDYASEAEWFNICERQAKFIINSVRIYEFFGYEWLLPLYDNYIFEFWSHIPIEYRYKRKLYFEIVDNNIKSTNDITVSSSIKSIFRDVPVINSFVRRMVRLFRYFDSPLYIENFISFGEWFKECFIGSPLFTVYGLQSNRQIRCLNDEVKE